jgi:hypothetical protein
MFLFGVVAIEVWETQLPVWAFVLALTICGSPILPRILYPVDMPLPIKHLRTRFRLVLFRPPPTRKLVLTSSRKLSSGMRFLADRLR